MREPAQLKDIPQPPTQPVLGNIADVGFETPVQNMVKLVARYGPIFKLSFPVGSIYIVGGYDLARDACDEGRFEKELHGPLRAIRAVAGDGLFTARNDEPNWGKAHRILAPAFGPAAMRNYFDDMLDVAEQMLTKWERLGPDTVHDVPDNMTRLTLDTIALCGFGYRFNSFYQHEMHPFVEAMVRSLAEAGARAKRLPLLTKLLFLTRQQFHTDIALMHGTTDALVALRRKANAGESPRDLLGLMLSTKDPVTGEMLDDINVRNQLVTFLIAGHETTSGLLSFAIYQLLRHPEVLTRASAEVDRVLGDETPRFEHVAKLVYIDQILRETLRLHPTAPAFAVHPKEDDVLAETYALTKGERLLILLPALHMDASVWESPETFDPERFSEARRAQIPPYAWMPFGNGMRSCIGRVFSLQESTLVLAMLLQRFTIALEEPYQLSIKETLTLKPEGLRIRARLRPGRSHSRGVVRASPTVVSISGASSSADESTVKATGIPFAVLYGSNSGSSESFARRIAGDASARGHTVVVAALDEAIDQLTKTGINIIVSASYNGQPPDNARTFMDWLRDLPTGALTGVRFVVFGCGNRDWGATYQAVPTLLSERLAAAGANAVYVRGEADARDDFFGDFDRWYAKFWPVVSESLGLAEVAPEEGPLLAVEVVPPADDEFIEQNKLVMATVTVNRELVAMTAPFARSKRHIELALPSGVSYRAGDYLAVLARNHPSLVARVARRWGLSPAAAIVLRSSRGAMSTALPLGRSISLTELLGGYVELSAPATRRDIERLARSNRCVPHHRHLLAIAESASQYQEEIWARRVSLLELLEEYPSCELSFAEFLELLPTMRARQYSISSSPRDNAAIAALTVAVIDAPAWSGKGSFRGTCSHYLASLVEGDAVPIAVRTPNVPFRPPMFNERPMIMICAGSGIAPFRGFIQDRAARDVAGEKAGEAMLFFGCDHPDVDYLYRDELAAWETSGVVSVKPAYFRLPSGEVSFVQHRVWQERSEVVRMIESGATIYVCGDGLHMAPAVRQTLLDIWADAAGCSTEAAGNWLLEMESSGRYVTDVFG